MSETNIVQGKIEIRGRAHGAINAIVYRFEDPSDWEFKQFVSQEELDRFASDNNYVIVTQGAQRE